MYIIALQDSLGRIAGVGGRGREIQLQCTKEAIQPKPKTTRYPKIAMYQLRCFLVRMLWLGEYKYVFPVT